LLRYAAVWGASAAWHTAEALLLAGSTLGPVERVFAATPTTPTTPTTPGGEPAAEYVSVLVEHRGGATSLLGCGAAEVDGGPAAPAALLLLGDGGAMEATPEGAALADADGWLDVLAEWLPGALRGLRSGLPSGGVLASWQRALAGLAAVQRSAVTGNPEPPEGLW
jgi:hypothetical protein